MARKATGNPRGRPPAVGLTPSEQRVYELLREGLVYAEIGVRLGITPDGVKYHVSNILGKLGLESRAELERVPIRSPHPLRRSWAAIPVAFRWAAGVTASLAAVACVLFFAGEPGQARQGDLFTGIVSTSYDGSRVWGKSYDPVISGDGRWIAFTSDADNLVPGDANGVPDVFLFDRQSGEMSRISAGHEKAEANGASGKPSISHDGRFVAFESEATNLVAGDVNADLPVSETERLTPLLQRETLPLGRPVTREIAQETLAGMSGPDVFVYDRNEEKTELVSVSSAGAQGDLESRSASISADGRYVAFASYATNLVDGDTNVGNPGEHERWQVMPKEGGYILSGRDIFLRDRDKGTTIRITVGPDGVEVSGHASRPVVSPDGKTVVFLSTAIELVTGIGPFLESGTSDGAQFLIATPRPYVYTRGEGVEALALPDHAAGSRVDLWDGPILTDDGTYVVLNVLSPVSEYSWNVAQTGTWFIPRGADTAAVLSSFTDPPRPETSAVSGDGGTLIFHQMNVHYPFAAHRPATGDVVPIHALSPRVNPGYTRLEQPVLSRDGSSAALVVSGDDMDSGSNASDVYAWEWPEQ